VHLLKDVRQEGDSLLGNLISADLDVEELAGKRLDTKRLNHKIFDNGRLSYLRCGE